jgi:multidrug efflux pump subunit AcrA (membrane-fusion protein)
MVAQVQDALERAERSLMAKDLLSRFEQADRETDIRSRKRDLQTAENQLRIAQDAIAAAERNVQNIQARVREARKRLGYATITAPLSGYVTELLVQNAQHVPLGGHLLTIARLDEFQVGVPIYDFDEFKRLKTGLTARILVGRPSSRGPLTGWPPPSRTAGGGPATSPSSASKATARRACSAWMPTSELFCRRRRRNPTASRRS